MLSISAIYHKLYVAGCSAEYLVKSFTIIIIFASRHKEYLLCAGQGVCGCDGATCWMGESARIYPNIPVWRHGGPPAHMALYLAASTTAHTYNIHLSTFPAPGSPQHRQHRQPGAGSPVSHSTNIVIYLSSSRQSPASGAAALGHSHTFTSPSLAQLCP